ncbi:murein DD-endopeptidase MepM/ murein hydrolase activator NlpD [Collimonas sp. PA-H2]|uniref:peptidoglycan DD-metalloendopeptidase family protein n=1 Tax=Collimonas sp. PA-H2 TaxID=1881062 RepID=UPI000C00D34A|nr:peptidoglycan DD-metalloendopeptidase family protein [Collimonas sp. PA-H2]PFH12637.1 murein DD-endopeptidase MepM/ murein hydrolase activator NlpD [Collimonas sp. PA-H2]
MSVQNTEASSSQHPGTSSSLRRALARIISPALPLAFLLALGACSTPSGPAQPSGPGYYTVQKGDTLSSIARKFKRSNSEIIAWNKLSDPNDIKVDQALRIAPDGARASGNPVASRTARPRNDDSDDAAAAAGEPKDALDWTWPAAGQSSRGAGQGRKGIDIAGQLGQPVMAAAAGKVTYAGSGIRGYGNLVIIKHSSYMLSVYAHNKTIMVKEGQMVSKGQTIAEMGKSDSNTVKLYFEIRRQGKAVDPTRYLPSR